MSEDNTRDYAIWSEQPGVPGVEIQYATAPTVQDAIRDTKPQRYPDAEITDVQEIGWLHEDEVMDILYESSTLTDVAKNARMLADKVEALAAEGFETDGVVDDRSLMYARPVDWEERT